MGANKVFLGFKVLSCTDLKVFSLIFVLLQLKLGSQELVLVWRIWSSPLHLKFCLHLLTKLNLMQSQ